jgi:hypothetical protein
VNEPIGGGASETCGITGGAISDPGSGGALTTGCGIEICPTSGTALGARTGTETRAGSGCAVAVTAGPLPASEVFFVTSSFTARLICTTASTHSVPQAIAEERSRSEDRMVDGGVTGC